MPTAFAPACGSIVAAGPSSPISRPAMATIRRAGNRPTAPSRSGSPAGSAGEGEAIAGEPFQGDPFPLRNDYGGVVVGAVLIGVSPARAGQTGIKDLLRGLGYEQGNVVYVVQPYRYSRVVAVLRSEKLVCGTSVSGT